MIGEEKNEFLKEKLQQASKSWSNFSSVLFGNIGFDIFATSTHSTNYLWDICKNELELYKKIMMIEVNE